VRAFITGPNGVGMTDLGTLGGGSSYALGVNDAGQVVGDPTTPQVLAMFLSPLQWRGHDRSGTLWRFSVANGINDAGQVVGVSDTARVAHSCLHHWPQWRGHDRSRRWVDLTARPMASTTPDRWWGLRHGQCFPCLYHRTLMACMTDLGALGGSEFRHRHQ
jgi:uncharacterized membrane protein